MNCFQEVPVAALVPSYVYNNHKVDWYIDELGIILEIHGKQHYEMANFGNDPYIDALKKVRPPTGKKVTPPASDSISPT